MTEAPAEDQTTELFPLPWAHGSITAEQHDFLMSNLRSSRVSHLQRAGRSFSHLEAWDIKAHLIRVFGFGNFDIETLEAKHLFTREYVGRDDNPMQEIAYQATVQLTIRAPDGSHLCRFSESSVDSQSGGTAFGDLHDNAIKSATSGALKRCATSLGTQFGLSLYDNGNTKDIVKVVLVRPEGATKGAQPTPGEAPQDDLSPEAAAALEHSLGAETVSDTATQPSSEAPESDGPAFERRADTPEQARAFAESAKQADSALDPDLRS
ncbi:MAG TPA: Rad52/Rad22 family DNA repair protein [Actinomycetes bacterium]|nr:Rad52/Rad22 family DNA repair protein [Actinomycetes bacterium]